MVLETIRRGRLVLVFGGQESQNYSGEVIRLKSTKIRWFLWWPGGRLDQLPSGRSRAVFSQAEAKKLSGLSPLRSDGSRDSPTGGGTSCLVVKTLK
jgi:hypothetical protein